MKSVGQNRNGSTKNAQPSFKEVAEFLGMKCPDPLSSQELTDQFARGFPETALQRLTQALAPDGPELKLVPFKVTIAASKRNDHRLSARESGAIYRLASVWIMALQAYRDPEMARSFIFSKNPHLRAVPYNLIREGLNGTRTVVTLLTDFGPEFKPHAYWLD